MMANVFSFHQCEFGARGCLLHIDHQGYGALLLGALLSPVPMRGNWLKGENCLGLLPERPSSTKPSAQPSIE
ncbi:hypothetical protein PVAP13_8KG364033 [Panicum virgatum]|uniref:Uncharacterized protein n=1 Tax=Panicum virgatum TaxID=38727 RepID=A0A8T0PYS2_PANVG|nr:hypothetical protein PVAP13_8KG364033 [Panicum virgatum]